MASGKGCQHLMVGRYWLAVVQEAVKNLVFRASILTNNILRFFLEENPVIIHVPVVIVPFFDELAVSMYIDVEIFV